MKEHHACYIHVVSLHHLRDGVTSHSASPRTPCLPTSVTLTQRGKSPAQVLPQAARAVVPPMTNIQIALLKNTTIAAGSVPGGRGESAGGTEGEQGGGGGVGGGGPRGGAGPNAVPADIPDGRDDDIVARQLREAAMKETDPELRERLWDEYRQYKKSTQ